MTDYVLLVFNITNENDAVREKCPVFVYVPVQVYHGEIKYLPDLYTCSLSDDENYKASMIMLNCFIFSEYKGDDKDLPYVSFLLHEDGNIKLDQKSKIIIQRTYFRTQSYDVHMHVSHMRYVCFNSVEEIKSMGVYE